MARNSVVIDLEVRNSQARAAIKGVEGGFTRLSQKSTQSTKAMSTGFGRASQSINSNVVGVQNLTRIIEDAPFGVRGVANNINPFIESFQRLSAQAGGTGAAMKSLLVSAFTGPGALLTISALVTSALTVISMGLFDMGEEAEGTEDALQGVLDTIDRIIEIRDQFGLFGEDEFGIVEAQARISKITEKIEEQQDILKLMNEQRKLELLLYQEGLNPAQQERLDQLNIELNGLGDIEDIQEIIKGLEEERQDISEDLVNIASGLADEEVRQAQAAERTKEAKQAQLDFEKQISAFRAGARTSAQAAQGLFSPSATRGEDTIFGEDVFTAIPQSAVDKELEKMNKVIAGFEGIGASAKEVGEEGKESIDKTTMAANLLGDALAQAIVRGEELEGVLKSLAAQLASRAIIRGLSFLLPGGPAIGSTGFFDNFFGFASGTDTAFPGMGIVGERGPELAVLPPMSSIITNENLEFMRRQQREARSGAENIAMMRQEPGMSVADFQRSVIDAIGRAEFNLPMSELSMRFSDYNELQDRIGNDPGS